MNSKKRTRLDVIYDILAAVRDHHNSIRLTPLLRCANLSSSGFGEYHAELIGKGFVKEVTDHDGRKYVTLTDKGFRFLERYRMIQGFIDEFEL